MKKCLLTSAVLLILATSAFAEFPAVKVYEKTAKNVVLIIAKGEETSSMIGAGSIISGSGLISTNAHVVVDKATSKPYSKIRVYLKPDKVTGKFKKDLVNSHKADVVAYDIDLDLAILQAEEMPSETGTMELADPDEIKVGEEAVAIGHPEQGGLWTLTYGRISGEIEDQNSIKGKDVFQTDASVNRGNSGGPLIDKRGYMIGINSNMARLGAGDVPITGVNFAVKSSVLKSWLQAQGITVAYGKADLYKEDSATPAGTELEADKKAEESQKEVAPVEKAAPPVEKVETPVQKSGPPVEKSAPVAEEVKPVVEKQEVKAKEEEKRVKQPEAEAKSPVEKAETPKVKEDKEDAKDKAKDKKPESKPAEKYQPHQKSYSYNDLLKAVEADLEDMMEEMRGKIRR
ncbi:MAG: trypsin-like peptidase domain-containing protein [Nitrospirae bacterium]|nr:trypsin-like peptidase domain-containing protein [Nitrospirota bacterium]